MKAKHYAATSLLFSSCSNDCSGISAVPKQKGTEKGHNGGKWENGASQRSYVSPFIGLLRDWVTRVHYCLPELPWSLGLCPHIVLKMAFFVIKQQGYSSFVPKNTTHTLTRCTIHQECGMFYKLYNCLDFMASSICNEDKYRGRCRQETLMSAVHSHHGCRFQSKATAVFALVCIKYTT